MKTRLKKYWDFLTARDKLLHFAAGTVIYLILNLIFNPDVAIGVTIAVGFFKEAIWDLILRKGKAEMVDFIMTAFPALLIYFLS